MQTETVTIGTQAVINVSMKEAAIGLDEVVVTALGIQREAKTLTYSAQQVDGAEVMKSQDMNIMNALSGKAAGLEIKRSASGAGGSTRTVLRGAKSFSGVSSPLYVIDGVPITNRTGDQVGMWGGVDQGDGISQLNPDDIESISVLKGSNAAILYGSQGANGVVMITTKKGTAGTVDISIGSATTFESVMLYPELQYNYGSRVNAETGKIAMENWDPTPLASYDDQFVKDFFQTGYNLVNNIAISGGNNRTTAYFSYANTASRGIIPENHYIKHNATFKQSTKIFNDKVTIGSNLMLTSEMAYNRPPNGYYMNPLTGLYWFPRQEDINVYKDNIGVWDSTVNFDKMNWLFTDHHQSNPWWIMNKQPRWDGGKRIIANANVEWEIAKGLKLQVRGTYDYANKKNEQRHSAGSNTTNVSRTGTWNYRQYVDWQSYFDGLLTYTTNFGDFSLNAVAGASFQETRYGDGISVNNGSTNELIFPNIYMFDNIPQNVIVRSIFSSSGIKQGVFANASFGWREMIFFDLSGRNDWSSTLALTGNESYFYPAVGLSGIISQMVSLPSFITFGKVRGSYSTVANEVNFDVINQHRQMNATTLVADQNQRGPFFEAKPEMLVSIEAGTDWRFLEGRAGFDFTYYHITSTDQFLDIPALAGSGYSRRYINAGKIVNSGIEFMIDAEPVATSNFSWRTSFNFARNNNKIVEVDPVDPKNRIALGNSEGYYSYIQAGGSFGDLYTYHLTYDDQGRVLVDDKNKALRTKEVQYSGSINPDFTLGWNNTFSYKNWSMGFLINGVFGGKVVSQTESMLDGYGSSKRSGEARDNGGYMDFAAAREDGTAVTLTAEEWYTGIGGRNGVLNEYVYDRTNIRFTQFSLNYNIPVRALNWPLKSASVGLIGQNLFFFYKKAPYDPELTMNSGRDSQALDNFNLPSTRTYGFNIKVNF
jgi:TonB-linked SusC/RagA family outer membrane protein